MLTGAAEGGNYEDNDTEPSGLQSAAVQVNDLCNRRDYWPALFTTFCVGANIAQVLSSKV